MMNESYDWWVAQVEAEDDDANVVVDAGPAPLDNEAYRRDFPEIDRWEDEGGSYQLPKPPRTVDATKFGDDEPTSIRIYEPGQQTLGGLIDEQIDLTQTVSEGTQVGVAGVGGYTVIVVARTDDE